MGENRLAGILIVLLTVLFLWLYNTGRWDDIADILAGRAPRNAVTVGNGIAQGENDPLQNFISTIGSLFDVTSIFKF